MKGTGYSRLSDKPCCKNNSNARTHFVGKHHIFVISYSGLAVDFFCFGLAECLFVSSFRLTFWNKCVHRKRSQYGQIDKETSFA